ncbi:hypothetical protein PM10SUCC1_09240 [Propionigenium maris DSM 9537]|uniref:DUF4129 domain-containing protein n=1 Tax=Propionigenium maris DSM 9537 TaxID=1123000 RepID=A0A9W6GK33_9FUSO|nr:hypothetical protein [Propionigenium maris]GLI55410.1 hypothetical protein PM10SUCC1_09240 [Propionigenium maris DSM 9537]
MKKLLLLILLVSHLALGRDILIGDRINLLISGSSEDKVREAFQAFEIEDIRESEEGSVVTLRSYHPGEQVVEIGDKRLVFNVKSSLEEGEREIYSDLSDGSARTLAKPRFPWIFAGGVLLGLSSLMYLLVGVIGRRKKKEQLSPREKFYGNLEDLGEDYTYRISYLTREYADHLMGSNLLSGRYEKSEGAPKELLHFLGELDSLKFARRSEGDREELKDRARELIESIEKTCNIGEAKEGSNV